MSNSITICPVLLSIFWTALQESWWSSVKFSSARVHQVFQSVCCFTSCCIITLLSLGLEKHIEKLGLKNVTYHFLFHSAVFLFKWELKHMFWFFSLHSTFILMFLLSFWISPLATPVSAQPPGRETDSGERESVPAETSSKLVFPAPMRQCGDVDPHVF